MAEVISARVGEDLLAGVDDMRGEQTRGAWVATLIEGELTDGLAAASPIAAIAGLRQAEPSPGVVCSGPTCWQRDTSRYGVRRARCAQPAQPHSRAAPTGGRSRRGPPHPPRP